MIKSSRIQIFHTNIGEILGSCSLDKIDMIFLGFLWFLLTSSYTISIEQFIVSSNVLDWKEITCSIITLVLSWLLITLITVSISVIHTTPSCIITFTSLVMIVFCLITTTITNTLFLTNINSNIRGWFLFWPILQNSERLATWMGTPILSTSTNKREIGFIRCIIALVETNGWVRQFTICGCSSTTLELGNLNFVIVEEKWFLMTSLGS